jgi:hypothetical protein
MISDKMILTREKALEHINSFAAYLQGVPDFVPMIEKKKVSWEEWKDHQLESAISDGSLVIVDKEQDTE